MKKIVFIEPKSSNLHVFSVFGIPRLGPIILATMLKEQGWDTKVFIEEISEVDYSEVLSADLVGISTITPTAPRAYEIARHIRQHGIPVIIGGPHVTFLPDEALEHCDFVIRGEAENVIGPFVDALFNQGDFSTLPGLSYRTGETVVHNPISEIPTDMKTLPIPDFSLVANMGAQKGISFKRIVPIQTSRGCPFACTFCSVTAMFGRKVRYRSIDSVIDEIQRYDPQRDFIFFYDDNFVVNKKRTMELLRRMIDMDLGFTWSAQVRIDIGRDKELLKLMRKSGCDQVYIGLESASDESLSLVKKAQTKIEMIRNIGAIRKNKIRIHGMFIFGFETDTIQGTRETCRFAMKNKLDSIQYLILTPLPGTPLYRELRDENRLIIKDWSFYDGHHVVHSPARMSPVDLQWAQVRATKRYFSLAERVRSILRLDIYRAVVQQMARRYYTRWFRDNRFYLKAIKLEKRASTALTKHKSNTILNLDIKIAYTDIKDRIEQALASLRKKAENDR